MQALTRTVPMLAVALSLFQPALADSPLTKELRHDTIQSLCKTLNERYVDAKAAKKIEAELTKKEAEGLFDNQTSGEQFAKQIMEICHGLVTDAHLRMRYSEETLPVRKVASEPSAAELAKYRDFVKFSNSSWTKVERLPGNIGYFAFNGFQEPADLNRPLKAAMDFLGETDAMIIDLRTNGGGSPAGVAAVCSYFFGDTPVHLNDISFRDGDKLIKNESWTAKKVDGKRYLDKEVYVLVSKRTGSGAEECAYDLQCLKRATIVGENTWGGANPGGNVRLNDHFAVFVPVGRAENPYTHKNWEGTGVTPDIKADPKESLKIAQILALNFLIKKSTDADQKASYEAALTELKK
ncbi:MAG: S41 family peptidase [Armatimonadota bacterium]